MSDNSNDITKGVYRDSGEKPQSESRPSSTARLRIIIAIGSLIVYGILFASMHHFAGRGMSITAIVPVIAVSWMYGMTIGIGAGFLSMPMNIGMCLLLGLEKDLMQMILDGGNVVGTCGLVLMGTVVGRMRDLTLQARSELLERNRVEQELKGHRDQLDDMVKQQTEELRTINAQLQEEIEVRKRAVEESRSIRRDLENLIETSLDPIIVSNSTGYITKPNKAFLKMVGYEEKDVVGKPMYEFSITERGVYESTAGEQVTVGDEFFEENAQQIGHLFREGTIYNWMSFYLRKDCKIIPVTQNILFLYDEEGVRTGSFGIIRDITEQRKTEIDLITSKEAAEAANHAKSTFLANMSHEIRTPMNGVVGFTDMLIDSGLDPEQNDYARTIKRSGEALLSLINDILDFSKIEAGKIDMENLEFDIEVLAYDVCELIRPRVDDTQVEILCRIGENLPSSVTGDPHRFRQVMVNLMGNAVKFTERGEVELSLDVEEQQDERILVHATIRDTGIGIAEDKIESIFELFEQADGSTTRKYGGTGLGLSICRRIASLMDGSVWAESQPGGGSTFHFTAWLQESHSKEARRMSPVALAGKRIYITDDNETNLEILSHIVTSAGMEAVTFSSGEAALDALQAAYASGNEQIDMCILDIMMPHMNGYSLARKIRAVAGDALPLLAFSSSAEGGTRECLRAGFNGFLPKPINRIKLLKMLERLLGEASDEDLQAERNAKVLTRYMLREDAKRATSILLAEDNPVNQHLAVKLLTKAGYQITVANNGKEALAFFTATPDNYDIIFMDVQMPELNGLDATRMLRAQGFDKVPVVAMTANAMKGDREKCLEAGMNDYIAKPIKREIVFSKLKQWVFDKM